MRQPLEVRVVTEEFLQLVKSYGELKCLEHFFHFIEFAFMLKKEQKEPCWVVPPELSYMYNCHFNILDSQSCIEHRDVEVVLVQLTNL